ncbi:hypothetical protein [Pseudoalteromonas umbrosa]|uniref:hypothetical protein n=1 Tax=Pseudoalteromonas umbrosa TaxID=3048489 RepID=UPI0024C4446B|nr:hypothetical protein [Pseudoalteromonas sp. B95]MDK1290100.1 hypothetical protein [Pseudoalteromonas sp. B95]
MSDKTRQKKLSRKAALKGQMKPLQGAAGKAAQELSNSMGNLGELFAQQQKQSSESTPIEQAPAEPASVAPEPTSVETQDKTSEAASASVPEEQKPVEVAANPIQADVPTPATAHVEQAPSTEVETPEVVEQTTELLKTPATPLLETEPAAVSGSNTGTLSVDNVNELHQILAKSKSAMFIEVNVNEVYSSLDNHRDFGISFERYLQVLPPLPNNWEELSGVEYVDQVWSDIIIEMTDNDELDDQSARVMRTTLIDVFDIGYSIQKKGQIHPPLGYLVYDQKTGQPERVELVSGEKRLRSHYMFGRKRAVLQFTEDSTAIEPSAEVNYSREELRLAENTQSKKPDADQIIDGVRKLYHAHIKRDGLEAVEKCSVAELVRLYAPALASAGGDTESRVVSRNARRYVNIATHPQAATFIRICKVASASVKKLDELRAKLTTAASELGCDITPAFVYASAAKADDVNFSMTDIPEILKEKALDALELLNGAKPQGEVQLSPEKHSKVVTQKMAKESQQKLGTYAMTVTKGKNAEPSRQYSFLQMMCMVVAVKGKVTTEDAAMLHRLNAERGEALGDEKLIRYRESLISAWESMESEAGILTNSSHETSMLIDRLAATSNPLNVIQEFIKEHNTDGSAK